MIGYFETLVIGPENLTFLFDVMNIGFLSLARNWCDPVTPVLLIEYYVFEMQR